MKLMNFKDKKILFQINATQCLVFLSGRRGYTAIQTKTKIINR